MRSLSLSKGKHDAYGDWIPAYAGMTEYSSFPRSRVGTSNKKASCEAFLYSFLN